MNTSMNTLQEHAVAPEELMAFLDGELSSEEAQTVSVHVASCAECAAVLEEFRATSAWMARWDAPPVPEKIQHKVMEQAASGEGQRKGRTLLGIRAWKLGTGFGLAAAALLLCVIAVQPDRHRTAERADKLLANSETLATLSPSTPEPAPPPPQSKQFDRLETFARLEPQGNARQRISADGGQHDLAPGTQGRLPKFSQAPVSPMIARTVNLTLTVKDMDAVRASLDRILTRDGGYAASLTANHPQDGPRELQASLRIPAPSLNAAVNEIKGLGRVTNETQNGEEVTQQHVDLEARLKNARETEDRYRAILQQHTGKVEDILEVEEQISTVREQIETMEAEMQTLEHRVDFSSVDVTISEEYEAPLHSDDSVGTKLHNAFVAGYRHLADTVLGLILFVEEFLPSLVLWLAILVLPVVLVVRRYRRMKNRV